MKDILNKLKEYYGLDVQDYECYKDGITFFVNGNYYLFTKCLFEEEYLNDILELCNYVRSSGIKIHDFVYNKEYKLISDGYVLFKINVFIEEIDFDDILLFKRLDCSKYLKKYVFMDKFWEDKIDYLEIQLSELSDNKLLNNSFDYYVGIAEILILYLKNNYDKEKIKLCLSHRCLECLDTLEFYNPLNISVDLPYKDVATYLRRKKDVLLLTSMIDESLRDGNYGYFFARMVFPFKYFHEVEGILVDKKSNRELIEIVNNVDNYERYLFDMEKMFGIFLFEWVKDSIKP